MNLFLAIAHIINGSDASVIEKYFDNAVKSSQTPYWQQCFKSFGLLPLIYDKSIKKEKLTIFMEDLKGTILNTIKR